MDTSGLNLDPLKKIVNIKFDLSKYALEIRHKYLFINSKLQRPLLIPGFKLIIILTILAVILPILYKNSYVRSPFAGTPLGSYMFCLGKPLCADARCVGESYRECRVCPTGTSRSVYKASCGENLYSTCKFNDTSCVDKSILNKIF